MRLLVVGFGPFPGIPRNPSGDLARAAAGSARLRRVLGGKSRCLVLRTAYAAIEDQLAPALAARPDAVLLFGVARRARRVRVEARARNRVSLLFPDASGQVFTRLQLDPDGPAERRSPHAARAARLLRDHGVEASLSRDAGRYLCNASYFVALAEDRPTLFIHIPMPPRTGRPKQADRVRRRGSADRRLRAFTTLALNLVRRARPTRV